MELQRVRFDLATDQRKLLLLKQWLVNSANFKIKKKVLTEVPITYLVLHSQTVGFDLVSLELSHVERGKVVIQDVTVKWYIFPRDSFVFLILVCSTERNPEKFLVFLRRLDYSNGRKCSESNYHPIGTLFGDPGSQPLNCQEQDRQEPADKTIYLFIALENMWVIFKYLLVLILT